VGQEAVALGQEAVDKVALVHHLQLLAGHLLLLLQLQELFQMVEAVVVAAVRLMAEQMEQVGVAVQQAELLAQEIHLQYLGLLFRVMQAEPVRLQVRLMAAVVVVVQEELERLAHQVLAVMVVMERLALLLQHLMGVLALVGLLLLVGLLEAAVAADKGLDPLVLQQVVVAQGQILEAWQELLAQLILEAEVEAALIQIHLGQRRLAATAVPVS
jgi:hypothetical protein